MELTDTIKNKIDDLFQDKRFNLSSVGLGYKYKNNIDTKEISIVFGVEKKKTKSELSQDEILPDTINVDGINIKTDVVEFETLHTVACFSSNDPSITRLTNLQSPIKGGQQIIKFPSGWISVPGGFAFSVGTLGFLATDSIDGKIVGVTNAHVAIQNSVLASQRNIDQQKLNPQNSIDQLLWIGDNNLYNQGAAVYLNNNLIKDLAPRIKRYYPIDTANANYIDCSLLIINPSYIDDLSYQVWQPIGNNVYPPSLPFATSSELNNLMSSNPKLYSTGRTTGPKGYSTSSSCALKIAGIGQSFTVTNSGNWTAQFSDCMTLKYVDESQGPIQGGDSGSAVLADISGERKIIGLVFAAGGNIGAFCRIDRVAEQMKISAFSVPINTSIPEPKLFSASESLASSPTITRNGKTYYQIGFTNNIYNQ